MTTHLDLATRPGLTGEEARRRLVRDGANAMTDVAEHPLRRALGKLWAPVPWMLEAAIVVQLILGDRVEAGVVGVLLIFNAALGFIQEGRARATLDALRSRLALVAAVRRDGAWTTRPAAELVADDVVKLSLGTIVPADAHVLDGSILVDQSMLTGESFPIEAGAGADVFAGSLIQRGEAVAVVTATGAGTKFGRTAELVRGAEAESQQQQTIFGVVRNLALFNGTVTVLLAIWAVFSPMPRGDILPLILVAILASIPVALPSMFSLAAAVGARALARRGVLPTRLSAIDEAAGIDILCCDKTGTLTRNALTVMEVRPMPGIDAARVLTAAALASSDGGRDPVDAAIRAAAQGQSGADAPTLVDFSAFDPALKRAEATVRRADGAIERIAKGAFETIAALARPEPTAAGMVDGLQSQGYRVLAVAAGPADHMALIGLVALSDPPRDDSAALVAELSDLGVRTVMVTGDAGATAETVARAIGIVGETWSGTPLPVDLDTDHRAVFAGVLPEDKYRLVQALQKSGHLIGMCGDGANDAPALRQAQMGIAVSTATDVAKSAAGMVLTEPGLAGIVAAIREGRTTFQRVLTYTLRSIVHKVAQVLFLAAGLVLTGQAILTPLLMVMMMVLGDFLAMTSSTDNVRPSSTPSRWKIRHLTIAGIVLGLTDLVFCVGSLAVGKFWLGLDLEALRTLTVATLVLSGQAIFYVSRERHHLWSSMPGRWLIVSSVVDVTIVTVFVTQGILMKALPVTHLAGLFAATVAFAFVLDAVKVALFRRLDIA